jgi:hypothetical protein
MKKKTETIWPDLWGRLNQPLTTEKEALEQLKSMVPLSDYGFEKLAKLLKEERLNQPKVTLKEAQEQTKRVMKAIRKSKKRVHNKRNNSV